MRTPGPASFKFRKHASIGAADAESDYEFLDSCFVDTGDIDVICDVASPKRIVVGRTGTGKSALLRELIREEAHAIELNPEDLALNHVANSNIIKFLDDAGVNLDSFYQLLWKHMLVVELLTLRFGLRSNTAKSLWERIKDGIDTSTNSAKKRAVDYVEEWAPNFWLESEHRIKEITQKFEESARAELKVKLNIAEIDLGAARSLTEDIKTEVVTRGQKVINDLQLHELAEVVRLLSDEIFVDPQQRYMIVIDTLDENWVDDRIRFKLIRALLEVVRSFQKIRQVKVVVALRIDLLRRVFNRTRDSGFQEEKFEGLCLNVKWNASQIKNLLERRINHLIKRQYSGTDVRFEEVFPNKISGMNAIDYMLERTLMRPRDAISFVNECLTLVEGKTAVNSATVKQAELSYSKGRLASLADEWSADYPALLTYIKILEGKKYKLRLSELSPAVVEAFIVEVCTSLPEADYIFRVGQDVIDGKRSHHAFVIEITKLLFGVGLIGIRPEGYDKAQWAFDAHSSISDGQIKPGSSIEVHPTFWRALGLRTSA